jgi:glycosyltransferase involved in cell wall biosynthesis
MNIERPLVSCIMPTANRERFVISAINNFLKQDYPNRELIIVDDGRIPVLSHIPNDKRIKYFFYDSIGTIGIKRNYACEKSKGDIIAHWDDDDWYADDWISKQVDTHVTYQPDITGLNRVIFFSPSLNKRWMYEDTDEEKPWVCGATMAYKKTFWKLNNFVDLQVGEDYDFVWNSNAKILALDYLNGFAAILHPYNTSIKPIENPQHKKLGLKWGETLKN